MKKLTRQIFQWITVITICFQITTIVDIVKALILANTVVPNFVIIMDYGVCVCTALVFIGFAIAFKKKYIYQLFFIILAIMQFFFVLMNWLPNESKILLLISSVLIFLNSLAQFYIGLNFTNLFKYTIMKNIGIGLLVNSLVGITIIFIQYIGFVNVFATMKQFRFILSIVDKLSFLYFFVSSFFFFRKYDRHFLIEK